MSNKERFTDIVDQLDRYGCPSEPVLDLLEAVTNLNDDVCNERLLDRSLAQVKDALAAFATADTSQAEQGMVKRTYLVSYIIPGGIGRNFHHRHTDDAPTSEDIEAMEKRIEKNIGFSPVTITSISRIGNSSVCSSDVVMPQ